MWKRGNGRQQGSQRRSPGHGRLSLQASRFSIQCQGNSAELAKKQRVSKSFVHLKTQYEAKSSKSKRNQRKKKNGKIPNGRRKSSYMLNYSESSTSSQYPVPGPSMGANGLIMSPMITMWMIPPAPRENSSTHVDFHHDQQPISK